MGDEVVNGTGEGVVLVGVEVRQTGVRILTLYGFRSLFLSPRRSKFTIAIGTRGAVVANIREAT